MYWNTNCCFCVAVTAGGYSHPYSLSLSVTLASFFLFAKKKSAFIRYIMICENVHSNVKLICLELFVIAPEEKERKRMDMMLVMLTIAISLRIMIVEDNDNDEE